MTDPEQPKKRRRGHNEGSIYQVKGGGYRGAVTIGYNANGRPKRKYVTGKTRAEVNRKILTLLNEHQRGMPISTQSTTVAAFLDQWLEQSVKPQKRLSTYETYETVVRVHLKPAIGRHKLDKLTAQQIEAMFAAQQSAGVSGRTRAKIRAVLRAALNQAMRWDLVPRNVASLTDPPKLEPFSGKPLSPSEVTKFLDATSGERFEALFVVAVWLGMRQGELLGLRWQDVDFDAGVIHVVKQLQWAGSKPTYPVLVDPKTESSRRRLPMPSPVAIALKRHRRRQLEDQVLAGERWKGAAWGLVFTTTVGTPLDPSSVVKHFRSVLDKAGIERRRFHDLRHSCATFLTSKNVHPRVIMQIMGHSDIGPSMHLYSHVELNTMKDALDSLSDLLDGTSDGS